MPLSTNDENCNPQNVVLSTLRTLILNLQNIVNDLSLQQDQLKKIIESRSKRMTAYVCENDKNTNEIRTSIEEMKDRIKAVEDKVSEIDDFLVTTKTNLAVWKKCLLFMKDFPAQIITFFASLATIAFFIAKYFGM